MNPENISVKSLLEEMPSQWDRNIARIDNKSFVLPMNLMVAAGVIANFGTQHLKKSNYLEFPANNSQPTDFSNPITPEPTPSPTQVTPIPPGDEFPTTPTIVQTVVLQQRQTEIPPPKSNVCDDSLDREICEASLNWIGAVIAAETSQAGGQGGQPEADLGRSNIGLWGYIGACFVSLGLAGIGAYFISRGKGSS